MAAPAPKPFFPRNLSAYAHSGGSSAAAAAAAPPQAPKKRTRAWPPKQQAKAPPPLLPATLPLVDLEDACMAGLAPDQMGAAQLLARGANVFVTGPGGCGKSRLIQSVVAAAKAAGNTVAVTATSGIAARNIDGSTLHALLGMRPGQALDATLANAKRYKSAALRGIHVLIVDEVSMLSAQELTTAVAVLKHVRGGALPVLLFVGDFLQLGPVAGDVALTSPVWQELQLNTVVLRTNFRQGADAEFYELLGEARFGRLSAKSVALLQARVGKVIGCNGVQPTELLSRVRGVDEKNAKCLAALPLPHTPFTMDVFMAQWSRATATWHRVFGDGEVRGDGAQPPSSPPPEGLTAELALVNLNGLGSVRRRPEVLAAAGALVSRGVLAPVLTLAVGAQVVFTCNIDPPMVVNGTRGCVESFDPVDGFPYVRMLCGTLRKVTPVIHTTELAKQVRVTAVSASAAKPRAGAGVGSGSGSDRDAAADDDDDDTDGDDIATGSGAARPRAVLSRHVGVAQLPLKLAFALTVHRAQGMTLDLGYADLGPDVFAPGLAYVALSRFPSLSSFALTAFVPACVRASPDVVAWYERQEIPEGVELPQAELRDDDGPPSP